MVDFPHGNWVDDDGDGHCVVCDEYGACREWLDTMADYAMVPVEWLEEKVASGAIDHNWGVSWVQERYLEERDGTN